MFTSLKIPLLALSTLVSSYVYAEHNSPIPAFKAQYTLSLGGMSIGETTRQLSFKHNQYHYSASSHSTGLAAVFKKDVIEERSVGRYQNQVFQPDSYSFQQTGGKKHKSEQLNFNWPKLQVVSQHNQENKTFNIPLGSLDNYAYQLQLMLDLSQHKKSLRYPIVKDNELNEYQIDIVGTELLNTPLGKLKTVVVQRKKADRTTKLWCAEALHYLPVKVAHAENDKTMVAEIASLEGIPLPTR